LSFSLYAPHTPPLNARLKRLAGLAQQVLVVVGAQLKEHVSLHRLLVLLADFPPSHLVLVPLTLTVPLVNLTFVIGVLQVVVLVLHHYLLALPIAILGIVMVMSVKPFLRLSLF